MNLKRTLIASIITLLSLGTAQSSFCATLVYDGFAAGGATPGPGEYETGTGFGAPGDALVAGIGSHTMQGPTTLGFNAANPWQNAGFMPGTGDFAGTVYYQAQATGLSYSQGPNQLVTTPGAVRHLHEATPADKNIERTIINNPTPGDVSYYSFLMRYESEDDNWSSTAELGVEQGASQGSARYTSVGINSDGELTAFESRNGNRVDGPALIQGEDHFVVVRLEELAGNPDSMHVWLDPALDAEPSTVSADIEIIDDFVYVGNNASFPFDTLGLFANLNNNGASNPQDFVFFDEFRLGTTFADVTPFTTAVPEPASLALWAFLGLIGLGYGWRRYRRP